MWEMRVKTNKKVEALDITEKVVDLVKDKRGKLLHIYVPHTTCGLLINENADPNVIKDILDCLQRIAPSDFPYKHLEGNADAHIKSSILNPFLLIPFLNGRPVLGTWQGIFLMEFDGPRDRRVILSLVE